KLRNRKLKHGICIEIRLCNDGQQSLFCRFHQTVSPRCHSKIQNIGSIEKAEIKQAAMQLKDFSYSFIDNSKYCKDKAEIYSEETKEQYQSVEEVIEALRYVSSHNQMIKNGGEIIVNDHYKTNVEMEKQLLLIQTSLGNVSLWSSKWKMLSITFKMKTNENIQK
ncbi:hypothetical protein RFI_34579, partial [Reticulomyxa filosa]